MIAVSDILAEVARHVAKGVTPNAVDVATAAPFKDYSRQAVWKRLQGLVKAKALQAVERFGRVIGYALPAEPPPPPEKRDRLAEILALVAAGVHAVKAIAARLRLSEVYVRQLAKRLERQERLFRVGPRGWLLVTSLADAAVAVAAYVAERTGFGAMARKAAEVVGSASALNTPAAPKQPSPTPVPKSEPAPIQWPQWPVPRFPGKRGPDEQKQPEPVTGPWAFL